MWFFGVVCVVMLPALVVVGLVGAEGAGAASTAGSPRPLSVMVQVSSLAPTYSAATLSSWLKQACSGGGVSAGGPSRDLVLEDIANPDGTLASAYLDAVVMFLGYSAEAPGASIGDDGGCD